MMFLWVFFELFCWVLAIPQSRTEAAEPEALSKCPNGHFVYFPWNLEQRAITYILPNLTSLETLHSVFREDPLCR